MCTRISTFKGKTVSEQCVFIIITPVGHTEQNVVQSPRRYYPTNKTVKSVTGSGFLTDFVENYLCFFGGGGTFTFIIFSLKTTIPNVH